MGEVGITGALASLVLIAVALVLSRREQLRLERDIVVAVLRSAAQLALVGAALGLVIAEDAWLGWSFVWVAAIVLIATGTIARRVPELPGGFPIALAATGTAAAVGLTVTFAFGIFPVTGRTVVPVAGMLTGNTMKAGVVVARRLVEAVAERRGEIEARLALGLPGPEAARPVVRGALRLAVSPQIEDTKALGLVLLPGTMTGLILAGVDPLDAVLTQAALMYLILGGVVTSATVIVLLATRRLFTPDHRLRPTVRSVQDE